MIGNSPLDILEKINEIKNILKGIETQRGYIDINAKLIVIMKNVKFISHIAKMGL